MQRDTEILESAEVHYRIAIIAGNDPYAYGDTWQTYEQLKLAGHAVELLDADIIDGLLTSEGAPDAELLDRFMEVFAPDYLSYQGESAAEILSALEGSGKGTSHRIRHFVVFGYVGPNNFGDELIFYLLRRSLAKRYPDSYISLIGQNPRQALKRHGVAGTFPNQRAAWRAMLNGADLQITFAGLMFEEPFVHRTSGLVDLFHDPFSEIAGQTAMVLLGWLCDVPTIFLGMGVQPLENPDAKQLVRLASLVRPTFCTRDTHSADNLRAVGVDPSLIHEMADLAFLLNPRDYLERPLETLSATKPPETPYIVVALREDDTPLPEPLLENIASALDSLYEDSGLHALFVDFAPEDRETHQKVASAMVHADTSAWCSTENIDDTLLIISHAAGSLTMRLHCAILATLFDIPTAVFDLNAKLQGFAEQVAINDCLVPLDASAETIRRVIADTLQRNVAGTQAAVQANRDLASEELAYLFERIDEQHPVPTAQPSYPRTRSEREIEAQRLYKELAESQRRCDEMQQQLNSVYASKSWKAGRAVTALPRAIKLLLAPKTD